MPNEVINTIHQLAAACNKYKGIAFMDKDGNIINDENGKMDVDQWDYNKLTGIAFNSLNPMANTDAKSIDEALGRRMITLLEKTWRLGVRDAED